MIKELEKQIKKILGNDYDFVQCGIDKAEYSIEHTDNVTCTIDVATVNFKDKTISTDTLQFQKLDDDKKKSLTRILVYFLFEGDYMNE